MYGQDISNVDRYNNLSEAARTYASTGGVEALMRGLGAVEVNPRFAQQGDVLIEAEGDGFPAAGVVVGGDVIWATLEDGVIRAPLRGRTGTLLRVPHG